jgi:DNA-binding response OmpR family regulator
MVSTPESTDFALVADHHMANEQSSKRYELAVGDFAAFLQTAKHETPPKDQPDQPNSYRLALGKDAIELGSVEFRILLFLASKPYHAFTRATIATAISTEENPVEAEMVDRHVASLLDQLGVFHDFVQAVPHIGYRFKA